MNREVDSHLSAKLDRSRREGSHGGGDRHASTIRIGGTWSVVRIVGTRGYGRLITTPLLRSQEFILHPVELLRLRIAVDVKGGHDSGTERGFVGRADFVFRSGGVGRLFLPLVFFPAWRVDNIQPRRFTNRTARACAQQF